VVKVKPTRNFIKLVERGPRHLAFLRKALKSSQVVLALLYDLFSVEVGHSHFQWAQWPLQACHPPMCHILL
jgi:hypothetical protein